MVDLDPELVLHALSLLPAGAQARAAQVCKLFFLLVAEIGRVSSFMASSVGPLGSIVASTQLEAPPTMGILFSKDSLDEDALGRLAQQVARAPVLAANWWHKRSSPHAGP